MSRLSIIIDTREQTPWAFDLARVDARVGTLRTGDYALEGDPHFGIERKSLEDFLGTISSGWGAFCRELNRMDEAAWVAKVIIVEGDFLSCVFQLDEAGELLPPPHRHYNLSPQFIEKRIAQLTMRGVSVLFARDPHLAAGLATAIFKLRSEQLEAANLIHHSNAIPSSQNRDSPDP
jgi:ERCC4-type nuclease